MGWRTLLKDELFVVDNVYPSSDVKYEVLTGWSERDEPEDKLLRSEFLVAVYYEKTR